MSTRYRAAPFVALRQRSPELGRYLYLKMNNLRIILYVVGVMSILFLCSCSILITQTPDEHATQFAKGEIKKCGEVEPRKKSELVENCIFESLKKREPFYAWYWLRPIDSVPAIGLILNGNNELFIVSYDSGYLWWGSIFSAVKCSSWSVYATDTKQKIICVLPGEESKYLFELGQFVPIQSNEDNNSLNRDAR